MGSLTFGIFIAALLIAFSCEWRWRTVGQVHRMYHVALEMGAPVEEIHAKAMRGGYMPEQPPVEIPEVS